MQHIVFPKMILLFSLSRFSLVKMKRYWSPDHWIVRVLKKNILCTSNIYARCVIFYFIANITWNMEHRVRKAHIFHKARSPHILDHLVSQCKERMVHRAYTRSIFHRILCKSIWYSPHISDMSHTLGIFDISVNHNSHQRDRLYMECTENRVHNANRACNHHILHTCQLRSHPSMLNIGTNLFRWKSIVTKISVCTFVSAFSIPWNAWLSPMSEVEIHVLLSRNCK